MSLEEQPEYRIFKFVKETLDGSTMGEIRKGAPVYGLFDIARNSKDEIFGRNTEPTLIFNTFMDEDDPIAFFQTKIAAIQSGIQQVILEKPFDYADSECMTGKEFEQFLKENSPQKDSEGGS